VGPFIAMVVSTVSLCIQPYAQTARKEASSRGKAVFLTARPFFGEGGFPLGKPRKEALPEAKLPVTGAPGP
jgi:hypothetical protein